MHSHLLADIGKAIIAAGLIGLPSYFFRIPLMLAYLLAGVILGPQIGFSIIKDSESIANISEIGLILLLFILGLEINLKKLLEAGRAVSLSGSVQILGSLVLALIYFGLFGYEFKFDLVYIAAACALSSTLIVVKILSDQMDLDSLPSRITLGILVIQDVFAIAFLALQPNLSDLNFLALAISISKVGILVSISWFLARYVLPPLFKKVGSHPELMLILTMGWCFAMCGIADYLTLSLEMGALVAGIAIASFPYRLDVSAKITSLRDFFITLFFVSLGLQIPMPNLEVIKLASLIIIFIYISRALTIYPILHRLGYANRASILPAINLSQVSEFSIVLATLGVTYNHISPKILSAFILAMVGSALLSSFLIPAAHTIYIKINPILKMIGFHDHVSADAVKKDSERQIKPSSIVILGFYKEASSLVYELKSKFSNEFMEQILVVDFNPEAHQELKRMNINCQYGDISNIDTLRHLDLHEAKMIICSIPDKILKGATNLSMTRTLKQLAPNSCIVVTADTIQSAREMYECGANYVFIPRVVGANYLVEMIERLQTGAAESIRAGAIEYLKDRNEVLR